MKVLGVNFFEGDVAKAVVEARKGGLIVAPSGPGLSKDLILSDSYRCALSKAEIVLPDSGLMCLWLKFFRKITLRRISGLEFLDKFLESIKRETSFFWVMPDKSQSEANLTWLREKHGIEIDESDVYNAPIYDKEGYLEDMKLLSKIELSRYNYIFIQIGGGVQERVGLYLRDKLSYKPCILCTGAALAFLSGEQIRIPKWADKYYLGWLFRCISNPKVFVPRYLSAFKLVYLLFRYREELPV